MSERILVVAAHPDDEALGCGGTLRVHANRGDSIAILFLADGVTARDGSKSGLAERRAAAVKASHLMGASEPRFLDFPDNRLDAVALLDLAKAVENYAREVSPTIVYTHHGGDLNVDHRRAHQAVMTAFRPVSGSGVRGILAFETPSSTEWSNLASGPIFTPDRFVDISETLAVKLELIKAYESEMREFPHPRSAKAVEALSVWRGASAGLRAAEAFETLRWIEK
jgi:LmbE family N-acetylglucosaminyl deacetylase